MTAVPGDEEAGYHEDRDSSWAGQAGLLPEGPEEEPGG